MLIVEYKPCYIALKYMCMIKKSDHIRSAYLKPKTKIFWVAFVNSTHNHIQHNYMLLLDE